MKRLQLFEFEDFSWFPDFIRSPMTRVLQALNKLMGMDEAIAILLQSVMHKTDVKTIVDLGSGSGGVMPLVFDKMVKQSDDAELVLTDFHPSKSAIEKYKNNTDGLSYHTEPVDATKAESMPSGIKTMINSFHHMPPLVAKGILSTAQKSNEPILIFEMQENKIPTIIWALFLPLGLLITFIMALVITPFSRPITLSQLILTYLIPVIPLCFAWDGQASFARMYSMEDYDELLPQSVESYRWKKGLGEKANGKKIGTYLIGMPTNS